MLLLPTQSYHCLLYLWASLIRTSVIFIYSNIFVTSQNKSKVTRNNTVHKRLLYLMLMIIYIYFFFLVYIFFWHTDDKKVWKKLSLVSLNLLEEWIKTLLDSGSAGEGLDNKWISFCMSAEDYNNPLLCFSKPACVFKWSWRSWLAAFRCNCRPDISKMRRELSKVGRTSERGRSLHTQRLSLLVLASVNCHWLTFQNKNL